MVQTWAVVVMTALTALAGVGREVVALRRCRARRASLENLVAGPGRCLRVVDRDADGAVIEITTAGSEPGEVSQNGGPGRSGN